MRVACLLLFVLVACGSETSPEASPAGGGNVAIGPGTRAVAGMASGGSAGDAGDAGAGGQGGATTACTNDEDIAALDSSFGGREVARECLVLDLTCVALTGDAYESCIAQCLGLRIPDLSLDCGRCFAAATRCELDNACTAACRFDICGETCRACTLEKGCLDALEDCTGLNDSSCPAMPPITN